MLREEINALTAEASKIIKLDWLNDKDENDGHLHCMKVVFFLLLVCMNTIVVSGLS